MPLDTPDQIVVKGVDLTGHAVLPGLHNTHLHSGLLRGTAESMSLWDWLEAYVDPAHKAMTAEIAATASLHCYAESVLAGTTSVMDMWRYMEGSAHVAAELGIRAALVEGGFLPHPEIPLDRPGDRWRWHLLVQRVADRLDPGAVGHARDLLDQGKVFELARSVTVAAVAVTLFLGGWRGFWPFHGALAWLGPFLWFLLKLTAVIYAMILVRATMPRMRYDRLMNFGWKVLIPFGLVWVMITGAVVQPSDRVAVPKAWHQVARIVDDAPLPGKALVLPLDDFYQVPTTWGFYGTDTMPTQLMTRPTIVPSAARTGSEPSAMASGSESTMQARRRSGSCAASSASRPMKSSLSSLTIHGMPASSGCDSAFVSWPTIT